uniref:Uncharacterized protein n=1 Tax=Anguilla anguilla TaxID=7936 RepID=A0A0E9QJX5_ANGAN
MSRSDSSSCAECSCQGSFGERTSRNTRIYSEAKEAVCVVYILNIWGESRPVWGSITTLTSLPSCFWNRTWVVKYYATEVL